MKDVLSKRSLWITWEKQRRNRTLSAALGVPLKELHSQAYWIVRYVILSFRTLLLLRQYRPEILFVQNPSLVLAFLAVHYGRAIGAPVVVDAHNGGLFPSEGKYGLVNRLARYIARQASLTLVTNKNLKSFVDHVGGVGYVLPDPLPSFRGNPSRSFSDGQKSVVFICTYAQDEPYLEVIEAAKTFDHRVVTFVTGKITGQARQRIGPVPSNVVLTGYLPDEKYIDLVLQADVILDLTTREDCLVCGAYEAVSACVPLIVSDTKALREYFDRGVLYTNNSRDDIRRQIHAALQDNDKLRKEVLDLRNAKLAAWDDLKKCLVELLKERFGVT